MKNSMTSPGRPAATMPSYIFSSSSGGRGLPPRAYGGSHSASFSPRRPLAAHKQWRLRPTGANAQPAVAGYLWDEHAGAFVPETIIVLTLRAASIEEITAFRSPELFPRFGLPEQLPARAT